MPIQSPAKDLRKTFAGALFGQGRETGSAQPTERPSRGLCPDRGAKRSQNSPPKDLEKPFKGRCAVADPVSRYSGASGQKNKGSTRYADAPLVRETDVRAVMMSSLLMVMPSFTDEHRTNCNTRSPRKIRFARCHGLPCGSQSELSGFRRRALFDNRSPCQLWPVLRRVPRRR